MKLVFDSSKLIKDNEKLISLLRLLGSLQFCIASETWYVGEEADRTPLPPQESVLSLAINIASTAETLHLFDFFVKKGIIVPSSNWSSRTLTAWEFIQSSQVSELKNNHLKYIRDKSAFHIDPEPILAYIEEASKTDDKLSMWEANDDGRMGHSPLASEIIANQLIKSTYDNIGTAQLTSKVFGALRDIVLEALNDILDFEVQK